MEDTGIKQLLSNYSFKQSKSLKELRECLASIPQNHPCEWRTPEDWGIESFSKEEMPWILKYGNNPVGIVSLEQKRNLMSLITDSGKMTYLCWISARCCWGTSLDFYLTTGRVMWCYILQTYHDIIAKESTGDFDFVVINHTTAEARGYHEKMGMRPYNGSIFRNSSIQSNIINYLSVMDCETEKVVREYLTGRGTTYLFYNSKSHTDYNGYGIAFMNKPRGNPRQEKIYNYKRDLQLRNLYLIYVSLWDDSDVKQLLGVRKREEEVDPHDDRKRLRIT